MVLGDSRLALLDVAVNQLLILLSLHNLLILLATFIPDWASTKKTESRHCCYDRTVEFWIADDIDVSGEHAHYVGAGGLTHGGSEEVGTDYEWLDDLVTTVLHHRDRLTREISDE